jgi:hypothetical protein
VVVLKKQNLEQAAKSRSKIKKKKKI